jgi:hypothetical protein
MVSFDVNKSCKYSCFLSVCLRQEDPSDLRINVYIINCCGVVCRHTSPSEKVRCVQGRSVSVALIHISSRTTPISKGKGGWSVAFYVPLHPTDDLICRRDNSDQIVWVVVYRAHIVTRIFQQPIRLCCIMIKIWVLTSSAPIPQSSLIVAQNGSLPCKV